MQLTLFYDVEININLLREREQEERSIIDSKNQAKKHRGVIRRHMHSTENHLLPASSCGAVVVLVP